MNIEERKKIAREAVNEPLSKERMRAWNDSTVVATWMREQWDAACTPSCEELDELPDGGRMEHDILRRIGRRAWLRNIGFYQAYSAVASLLLLVGIGAAAYFLLEREAPAMRYVVSSGTRGFENVVLPDGTSVRMGPGSRLTYPGTFDGSTREVSLEGQAFFDVAKDRSKPFIVHAGRMEVEALGTAFELFSYDTERWEEATLLNGRIRVSLPSKDQGTEEVILSPDERFTFDKRNGSVVVKKVDADSYTAWRRDGRISFVNEPLSVIIPRLERWYGHKIACPSDLANRLRFTFKVNDESLESILFLMRQTSGVRYERVTESDYRLLPPV